MRDLINKIKIAKNVVFGDYNAATKALVAVDLSGFNSVVLAIDVGTMTGAGTFTPALMESDNGTDFTAVAAAEVVGTLGALVTNTPQKVGYNGSKRYIGLNVVKAGVVSAANFGITAVLGDAETEPVA